MSLHGPLLWGHVQRGRRLDLYGGDGHEPGQVLHQGLQKQPNHSRKHPGKNCILSCECLTLPTLTTESHPQRREAIQHINQSER